MHVLGIRSKTQVTASVARPRPAGCSRSAASASARTRSISTPRNQRGVPVFNAPFSNTRSVAELVIAEIIVLARQLGDRSREVHEGSWRKKVAVGCYEVRGKTLGIVGYGHIGRQVGVLAEALGHARALLRHRARSCRWATTGPLASLAELLAQADFVTLHVPETPQTRGPDRRARARAR